MSLSVSLRRPVAVLPAAAGGPAGDSARFLAADGAVFEAPAGVFSVEDLPRVDPGETGAGDLDKLVLFLNAAGGEALPARLVRMEASRDGGGWTGTLDDGTRLLWGRLRWTEEKLRRLRAVLADARPRFEGALTADLRHFEDGKIFVRVR